MDSKIERILQINNLQNELEDLEEQDFQEWDLFHKKTALTIKKLFDGESQHLRDWLKIDVPEEPTLEDDNGFSVYLHNRKIAREKMEDLLEVMAEDINSSMPYEKQIQRQKNESKTVFIVHGTDYQPVKELKAILLDIGIKPIILHEQPSKGMTIIEKLEEYSDVGFAFILLTPDDLGVSEKQLMSNINSFMKKDNPTKDQITDFITNINRPIGILLMSQIMELVENRARQNVIMEFGYFIGRLGRRKVCCLYKGDIELPSDMHGICYLHFSNSINEVKETIIEELKAAKLIPS
jgi:predicted nucleotide-binding protein